MNLIASAFWYYGYNELSTMTLKKTSPVTQSVANTAKRVIVIVGVALVLGRIVGPHEARRLRYWNRRCLPLLHH